MIRWRWLAVSWLLVPALNAAAHDANRLTYLDESDPYYVSRGFPKLTAPQWVGEDGVEAVVVLAIDDMRGHEQWEAYLRPILERLKQIDGRAPVSIMTNRIDPREEHLQQWLEEGLSLEVHTIDHPCPCLQGGDFAKARSTYERCVDQMDAVPHSRAVAFRMPCCDSLNTLSPRFLAEIFNRRTEQGNFLAIDSSVFNLTTPNDPALPRELVYDADGRDRFRRYLPFPSFVNTIEDYPYPYVIGRLCWELPCAVPSDWQSEHIQQSGNPRLVEDLGRALDAAVLKQGTFDFVFHPYGWIRNEQVSQFVDQAVARHGRRIKFLNFREVLERIDKNLLAGQPLRAADGGDNGVRLLDLNADGYLDVVIGNEQLRQTRVWQPRERRWQVTDFPLALVTVDAGARREVGARFGIVHADGLPSLIVRTEQTKAAWHWDGRRWNAANELLAGLDLDGRPVLTAEAGRDRGVRLRDLDGDGCAELIVANDRQQAVFGWSQSTASWRRLQFKLPAGAALVDAAGHDAGLRLVDLDEDGHDDLLFANETASGLHLFESLEAGWSRHVPAADRGSGLGLPLISRQGTNNGAWLHSRHLWVQNEDTNRLPDLVDRRSYNDLLKDVVPGPKTPQASWRALRARPGFAVELMAAEPLVMDPIALAWGPDAKLWVVEMGDYPLGTDGQGKPGGRVRYLEDTDGDGRYDRSTVFLDELGYPTGVAPWRGGVIVACAPDIFYAEDRDGDGRADHRETLFRGFGQGNQQHRVNGLKWGLDGWLYCANGDSGGRIQSLKTGAEHDLGGRDFRIRSDEGLLDPQFGISQYGRNCDDWGNWFGCNNSNPMWQFVLSDQYQRRNPHVPAPEVRVPVSKVPGAAPVYPLSRTVMRFNDPGAANRFTSANSAMVYRDELFGPRFSASTFVSEPVHNLVHRELLTRNGLTFASRRDDDEQTSEFLASSDNWFRPTMLCTGPDGALWVADMYRLVIEHPQWIPRQWQEQLDLRAGAGQGRIYRVYPVGAKPRPIVRLDQLSGAELAAAIDSPSGWQRDTVQQLLVWRQDRSAAAELARIATASQRPAARVQALCALDGLEALDAKTLQAALGDAHPGVRRHAVRLAEPRLASDERLAAAVLRLEDDADPQVQLQWIYSLGAWSDERAAAALGRVGVARRQDPFFRAAVLSSTNAGNVGALLAAALAGQGDGAPEFVEQLVGLAAALGDQAALPAALAAIARPAGDSFAGWQLAALAGLLDTLERRHTALDQAGIDEASLGPLLKFARRAAANAGAPAETRVAAVRLLARDPAERAADVDRLAALLVPQTNGDLQAAAVESLGRFEHAQVPAVLVRGWKGYSPALKSRILDVLLTRDSSTAALLDALAARAIPVGDIDAAHRQRLIQHVNPELRERAAQLLAESGATDRQQVLERFQDVLTASGDATAGRQVFSRRCAQCHKLGDMGYALGPDLAALADKPASFFLISILDPNRAVEARYVDYVAVTDRGQTFTGLLAAETGTHITLAGPEGKQQVILRSELESLGTSGRSLMPEGLEKDVTKPELVNLLAFVRAAGPARKVFAGNEPQRIVVQPDGSLLLPAAAAEIFGPTLVFESQYKNLGYWSNAADHARWTIEVARAGRYEVQLDYACDEASAGNEFRLLVGEQCLQGKVAGTGSWDQYRQTTVGTLELPAGAAAVSFGPAGPVRGALIDLRAIQLRPEKQDGK